MGVGFNVPSPRRANLEGTKRITGDWARKAKRIRKFYVAFAVSSDKDPEEVIARVVHE